MGGRDVTTDFLDIGHSREAENIAKEYLKGRIHLS
jgi:hypothetical protein